MTVNKYVADYRLIEEFDANGHVKTTTEYIGDYYYYLAEPESRRKAAYAVLAAAVAECVFWIAALVPYSAVMQRMYVSLPFVFAAVPLFLLLGVIWKIVRLKEPLEHRHADKIQNRYPATCAIGGLLEAMALIAAIITILLGVEPQTGDFIFLGCAVGTVCMSLYIFAQKESFVLKGKKQ
ncbi:MAG: hypothetical protein IKE43_05355 [Coriobacteriales bacterium]|nr:hypothetical protein [Coriobacteriales bacterium]